tara:strand:- start:12523 stop:14169 length:1647 start_codon:yes stop_codon:yes gene_type:complete
MRSIFYLLCITLVACDTTTPSDETPATNDEVVFVGSNITPGAVTDNDPGVQQQEESKEPVPLQEDRTSNPVETEEPELEELVNAETEEEAETIEEEVPAPDDQITIDDLTNANLEQIELTREYIFVGLDVGKELYLEEVTLVLQELGIVNNYEGIFDANGEIPEIETCPFVEYYNNEPPVDPILCKYMVDKAKADAYSKLVSRLDQHNPINKNEVMTDEEYEEFEFWYQQGGISGVEESRVLVDIDIKAKALCDQVPTPISSAVQKGLDIGRQMLTNSINSWLATNGYIPDYPVVSQPIEVCNADISLLEPANQEALKSISQAMLDDPLCPDYEPYDNESALMWAQAKSDYQAAIKSGIKNEFALAAVKIFKVVPCNVSDPLIMDVNGNGKFDILPVSKGVNFNIYGDRPVAIAWTHEDGFLFLDKNDNGIVDDGTELFGTSFEFRGGFDHLRIYDSNKDGLITPSDIAYQDMYIWVDSDNNGICDMPEVQSLIKWGVRKISLNKTSKRELIKGSLLKSVGVATRDNGESVVVGDVLLKAGYFARLSQ